MKFKALLFLVLLAINLPAVLAMEPINPVEAAQIDALSKTNTQGTPDELTVIDNEGISFKLNKTLSQALLRCESLSAYSDFAKGNIDFSNQRSFITKDLIIELAQFIYNSDSEAFTVNNYDLDFFELAAYLAAPEKVLFILANELWPEMQHDPILSESQNAYKKHLRKLAEPYLACPEHLLLFMKKNNISPHVIIDKHRHLNYDVKINLSSNHILNISNLNSHDIVSDTYLTQYKFCTLRGLTQLIDYLSPDKKNHAFHQINLSNHKLETFSIKELQSTFKSTNQPDIILDNNNIKKLSTQEIDSLEGSFALHLNNNPIKLIENPFFEAIRKARGKDLLLFGGMGRYNFSIKNNALSTQEKNNYKKKFYEATHTIPERFTSPNILWHGSFWLPALMSGFLTTKLFQNYDIIKGSTATGIGFVAGGVAGGIAGQYAMGYVISKIAQKTHPEISNLNMAMVEGSERFTLELD